MLGHFGQRWGTSGGPSTTISTLVSLQYRPKLPTIENYEFF